MEIDRMEWLEAIRSHYGGIGVTPWDVAAEILLGRSDPDSVAESIRRRGRKVGDDVMTTTTADDVADAVEELIGFGFLESVFAASSPRQDARFGFEEHVLELRMP